MVASVDGTVIWELAVDEASMAKPIGTPYKEGDVVCWVSAYFGNEEIKALYDGKLVAVVAKQGAKVKKGDLIAFIG